MNKVILVGNLCREPEHRTTQRGTSTTVFAVAVQKAFKNAEGGYDADFINCVAWGNTADFISNYFHKGDKIGLEGTLSTRSYEGKGGEKKYVTEVSVDRAEFVSARRAENTKEQKTEVLDDFFNDMKPVDDADLPF